MEQRFLRLAEAMGVRASILDAVIWSQIARGRNLGEVYALNKRVLQQKAQAFRGHFGEEP